MKKILVIANPAAGSGKKIKRINSIVKFFEDKGIDVTLHQTKKQNEATIIAKQKSKNYDCVIAAGGDGTINEVINGLAGKNTPLGIIALGTENVLAKGLKLPLSPTKACESILKKKPKKIDLGKANNRYFVLMTGIGFDAYVASKIEPFFKKLMGSTAYALKALESLFRYDAKELDVIIDDKIKTKGYFVLVANSKHYASFMRFAAKASLMDGKLDVCIFKNKDIVNMTKYILAAFAWRTHIFADVEYHKAKKVKITSIEKVLAHTDCELIGPTPVDIKVCPKSLKLIF